MRGAGNHLVLWAPTCLDLIYLEPSTAGINCTSNWCRAADSLKELIRWISYTWSEAGLFPSPACVRERACVCGWVGACVGRPQKVRGRGLIKASSPSNEHPGLISVSRDRRLCNEKSTCKLWMTLFSCRYCDIFSYTESLCSSTFL